MKSIAAPQYASLLAATLCVVGSAGCVAEPTVRDVAYTGYNIEAGCYRQRTVERPVEYWPETGACVDGGGGEYFADPEGLCVFRSGTCWGEEEENAGQPIWERADPYFLDCSTVPGCCDAAVWEFPECES